jgi:hypothetical protein
MAAQYLNESRKIVFTDMNLIHLVQDAVQWLPLAKTVMKLSIPTRRVIIVESSVTSGRPHLIDVDINKQIPKCMAKFSAALGIGEFRHF